jgi:serine protease Do
MRFWKTGLAVVTLCSAGAIGLAAASQGHVFQWDDDNDATQVFDIGIRGGSRIGISIDDVSPDDVQARKLASESGAIVRDVDDDMPAAEAGIKAGDVIVEYDGEKVRSARQLTRLVQETPAGRKVSAVVTRDGTRMTFTLAPEAATAPSVYSFSGPRAPRAPRAPMAPPRPPRAPRPPAFDGDFDMPAPPAAPVFSMPNVEVFGNGFAYAFGGGRLGVSVTTLSDQLATYFGVEEGVLVTEVNDDTAASKAGIKAGDVITKVDGTRIEDSGDLIRELADASGDVSIEVVRDRKTQTLKATIEETPRRTSRRVI